MAIRWASVSALQRAICSAANKSTIDAVLWRNMSSSAATANVGFIGLGNMGGHMARNLMKKVGFFYREKCKSHVMCRYLLFLVFSIHFICLRKQPSSLFVRSKFLQMTHFIFYFRQQMISHNFSLALVGPASNTRRIFQTMCLCVHESDV